MKNRSGKYRPTFVSFDDKGSNSFAAYESRLEKKNITVTLCYVFAAFFTVLTVLLQVKYAEIGGGLEPFYSFLAMNVSIILWLELAVTNLVRGKYLQAAISPVAIIWLFLVVESYTMSYSTSVFITLR